MKLFKIWTLVFLIRGPIAQASLSTFSQLKVLDVAQASAVAYTSEDYNGSIPLWVINGQILQTPEVRKRLMAEPVSACTIWVLNWGDPKATHKEELTRSLLATENRLLLWKNISGQLIFEDQASGHALSFVCVIYSRDSQIFTETTNVDYSKHFQEILDFL